MDKVFVKILETRILELTYFLTLMSDKNELKLVVKRTLETNQALLKFVKSYEIERISKRLQ